MERFPLEPAADLAGNYARHMALRVWGDDLTPKAEALRCGSCGEEVAELKPCTWDPDLQISACCEIDLNAEAIGCKGMAA